MSSRARLRCWETFNRWSTVMFCRQRTLHILWSRRPTGRQSFHSPSTATGAPFAKKDGFLAFWIQNLISGTRTLACVLRKSSLCQCGCRGYSILFPVLSVQRCSIGVMGTGYFPTARHDGSSWDSTDRSQSRRGALAATGAVIYIRCDNNVILLMDTQCAPVPDVLLQSRHDARPEELHP